ncbi:MAG TPA: hypothetical protein VK559_05250 [Ferruginibacter sp.]|nr:hypothetical protein [Ferruginibacter sp.]
MKKILILALAVGCFFVSFSQTQVLNSWKDPNTSIANPSVHKIIVAALLYNQSVRRNVEDYMVTLYPGVATQSYLILGGDSILSDENGESRRLRSLGYDGVVIMKQTDKNSTQQYVPGAGGNYYYRTWGGYWHHGWGRVYYDPGPPGAVRTLNNWFVQVNIYSLVNNDNKLVWSGNTETTNPGGRVPLFTDVCDAVRSQMVSDGFLR